MPLEARNEYQFIQKHIYRDGMALQQLASELDPQLNYKE